MTSLSDPAPRVIDIAPPEWCWSHLRNATQGLMTFRSDRRPTSLAVLYSVHSRQIIIPIAAFNETAYGAVGTDVTLEVTGLGRNGALWTVRATGSALLHSGRKPARETDALRPTRPDDGSKPRTDCLVVPIVRIRGFYETSLDSTVPPAG